MTDSKLNYQSQYIQHTDGTNLHILDWQNSAASQTCLLLHGFTNDAHIFDGLNTQLQKSHRVIAVDFRGHGDSDWDNQSRYQHKQLIDDVSFIINSLKLDANNLHIIGHSLGARIAMLLIAQKNLQPASLTVIDTGPEVRAIGVKKVRQDAEATPKTFANHQAFEDFLKNIYFLAEPEKIHQMALHGLKEVDGKLVPKTDPNFTKALWKSDSQQGDSSDLTAPLNQELWQALEKVTCPTMIIKGQASAILSNQTAEKMLQLLSHSALKIIERAGHAVMVDNPRAYEAEQLAFITKPNKP